ncbi:MAG TPA: hypothetical protein VGG39_18660 [Polyangiaceae bacterium]|jgi:hypothetical protein
MLGGRRELEHVIRAAADRRFIEAAIAAGYLQKETLLTRLPTMPLDDAQTERIRVRIAHDFARLPGARKA